MFLKQRSADNGWEVKSGLFVPAAAVVKKLR
jgi:hypothetical protein